MLVNFYQLTQCHILNFYQLIQGHILDFYQLTQCHILNFYQLTQCHIRIDNILYYTFLHRITEQSNMHCKMTKEQAMSHSTVANRSKFHLSWCYCTDSFRKDSLHKARYMTQLEHCYNCIK